jgi:hypothetical protein
MGLWEYLKSWDLPEQSGDSRKNASGADSDAADYDGGVPARWPMPENKEYGYGPDGNSGGYGHSSDCADVGQKGSTWGMTQAEIAAGYSKPPSDGEGGVLESRQVDGSYPQSLPTSNPHDRGSGSESRAKEFSSTEGKGFDGTGTTRNRTGMGARENLG